LKKGTAKIAATTINATANAIAAPPL